MNRSRMIVTVITAAVIVGGGVYSRLGGRFGSATIFTTSQGAIDGFDPVAYFRDGKPERGSDAHTVKWKGATWRFSSEEHRRMFTAEPDKYAPEYGGYCAYGMSEGYLAPIDPEAWTIVDGRLFLNFDPDVRTNWLETKDRRIPRADEHWANY